MMARWAVATLIAISSCVAQAQYSARVELTAVVEYALSSVAWGVHVVRLSPVIGEDSATFFARCPGGEVTMPGLSQSGQIMPGEQRLEGVMLLQEAIVHGRTVTGVVYPDLLLRTCVWADLRWTPPEAQPGD